MMVPVVNNGQVVYEVNTEIDVALVEDYRAWLDTYVREMVALPGFIGAHIYNVLAPAPAAGMQTICTQLVLRDTAALDVYLREHALRFRTISHQRFGNRFRTTRRVMRHVVRLDPPQA